MGKFCPTQFLLLLLCVICLSNAYQGDEIGAILEETKAMADNMTGRVDTMTGSLNENLRLIKHTEAKLMQIVRKLRGDLTNRTQNGGWAKGGAIYTRWGRSTCPDDVEMAYSGYSVGGSFSQLGSTSNILCAHNEPHFNKSFIANTTAVNFLYGVEYKDMWKAELNNQDVPCAVCIIASRSVAIMVPGRHECMTGWHGQYWGYLVGGFHGHNSNADFICVDSKPESIDGGFASTNGRILYHVKSACGSLPCPPYKADHVIPCVVCTR